METAVRGVTAGLDALASADPDDRAAILPALRALRVALDRALGPDA